MSRRSNLPLPRALKMPLRDVLRGVATVADITEEVLEPAAALLPTPVRSSFRSALATFEEAGNRAVTPTVDLADIARASAFLRGKDTSREAVETFVNVLAHVWEKTRSRHGDHTLLFSETVAAASLVVRQSGERRTAYAHAAAILTSLRKANVASKLPGMPVAPSKEEQAYIDQSLLSASVWLLSERGSTLAEEERLLELAFALIQALESDALTGMADEKLLAEQMKSLAEHL
ncbi:MAG: hypothetical protein AAF543_04930 [Pseudomonadota bacterium]